MDNESIRLNYEPTFILLNLFLRYNKQFFIVALQLGPQIID